MENETELYGRFLKHTADYMVPDLEKKLEAAVRSRFHDCLIYRESTLNVSPAQLQFLMKSCSVFDHCSKEDIISFVIDWITVGKSKEHEAVACEILDFVSGIKTALHEDHGDDHRNKEVVEKIKVALEGKSTWDSIDYKHLLTGHMDIELDTYFVCSKGKTVYLILKVNVFKEPASSDGQLYFRCYQLSEQNAWHFIFRTPKIDEKFVDSVEFSAAVSETSEEMVIMYRDSKFHLFVADLKIVGKSRVKISHLVEDIEHLYTSWILGDKDHFLFLEDSSRKDKEKFIHCRCKYKLGSKELSMCSSNETVVDVYNEWYSSPPCSYFLNYIDKRCVWLFEGNRVNGSSLRAVTLDKDGGLTLCTHTPPPFSCVTEMMAGTVKSQFLASLKPIKKYLTDETRITDDLD